VKSFFNSPYNFSFKDLIAAVFIGSFLYFCWKASDNSQALELVQSLVSLVGIILGGYFVQEGAAMYFQRSQNTDTTQRQQYSSTKVTSTINTSPTPDPAQAEQGEAGPL
jgi:hypothetical protein